MKFRVHRPEIDPREEDLLAREIRELSAGEPEPSPPAGAYWPNMLVRINRRIDEASSGVAVSLSWAARVAIPGVVAVLSFVIGLQYYVPKPAGDVSMQDLLARGGMDSLIVQQVDEQNAVAQELLADAYLDLTHEQLSEYLVDNVAPSAVMDVLPEADVREVLSTLGGAPR
jgi:hypothetical protein